MGFDFSNKATQANQNEFGFTGMDTGPSMSDENRSIKETGVPTIVNTINNIVN